MSLHAASQLAHTEENVDPLFEMRAVTLGLPPQAVKKQRPHSITFCVPAPGGTTPGASAPPAQRKRPCWERMREESPPISRRGGLHVLVRGVTSWKFFEIVDANSYAFGRTFSQKINTCESAKYTTHFHFRLYITCIQHGVKLKTGQLWRPGQDYDGTWDRGVRKQDVPAKTGRVARSSSREH